MYKQGKNCRIVMVGGGSVNWSPRLINDIMLTQGLEKAEYVILDIDEIAGRRIVQLGRLLNAQRGLDCSFEYTSSHQEAFTGADFVIITISTGGLDAMEYDIKIPEAYGIYHTVGDSAGPGGWARGLRNIQVFKELALDIEKYAPEAVVLNYTNPMAVLTRVFSKVGGLKTVGLCHSAFENYSVMAEIFNLDDKNGIDITFAGTNHFIWVLGMKINGEDGYSMLREKMHGRKFHELLTEVKLKKAGLHSGVKVCSELFEQTGVLPYIGDRHICEFIPGYITKDLKKLEESGLIRTSIQDRRSSLQKGNARLDDYLTGKEKMPDERSREIAADIVAAFVLGKEITDVVNLPNSGQIENLPKGPVVETFGTIGQNGFTTVEVLNLPEPILNLVLPHAINQELIVEAGLEGDMDKAFQALYKDPLCSHLSSKEIKEMGELLLKSHKQFLPQFTF